ncbi:MAG: APC family permease [Alphaproteobacteria bacterium]|nr:APC family permease [Alphaproteobacteria bacterium]
MKTELKAGALSLFESVVMGVAGSAPGYTIAVTTAVLLGVAKALSPGALLIFAVPMLGIAVAYKALNRRHVSAGAAYQWTSIYFGRFWGFFSGWALLVASMVFMVTGSLPLATATLDFVDPALADNVVLSAGVASVWFLAVATVLIVGIKVTSGVQVVMTSIELVILTIVLAAAFVHAGHTGAVNAFSWSWFGFGYSAKTFAASALVVVFFYWGWDVTANLGEETHNGSENAGNGGFASVFITIAYYIAFVFAALFLFQLNEARGFNANIIYNIAVAAGLGRTGGLFASIAVILSSIATLETTMLQFSRTLFAMGRDGAMPALFGIVDARTQTPVRAMLVLVGVGLLLVWGSSLMPTVHQIILDSVNAVGVLVSYYYGLAGLAAGWAFRRVLHESFARWLGLAVFPTLSGLLLIVLGIYAMTTFDLITNAVGIGGLIGGIVFFRPRGRASLPALAG